MGRQAKNRAGESQPAGLRRFHNPSRIGFAVAAAIAGAALPHRTPAAEASDSSGGLQEVIVTARKVSENLQDVPISVDVLTKKDMQNLGISSFDDYAQKMPSISFISVGPGTQLFVLRGASDGSNPNYANTSATGFILDDMSMSWSGVQPDLHLYDMESIQVLNGPQGTTFGASSMSGAIINTTVKPDVNAFSAGVDFERRSDSRRRTELDLRGLRELPVDGGGARAAHVGVQRFPGWLHQQPAGHPYLGKRRGVGQLAVGTR